MLYGPAHLFVKPTLESFASTLGMQLVWIAALGLLTTLAYRRGIRYLTVNGG